MLTLKSLKTELDAVRAVADVAHSNAIGARQLLEAQAVSFVTLNATVSSLEAEMRAGFARLDASVGNLDSGLQAREINAYTTTADLKVIKADVATLKDDVQRIDLRLDGMDQRQDRMDQRQDRMDQRQDRMDKNIAAIMRHMGISPDE